MRDMTDGQMAAVMMAVTNTTDLAEIGRFIDGNFVHRRKAEARQSMQFVDPVLISMPGGENNLDFTLIPPHHRFVRLEQRQTDRLFVCELGQLGFGQASYTGMGKTPADALKAACDHLNMIDAAQRRELRKRL